MPASRTGGAPPGVAQSRKQTRRKSPGVHSPRPDAAGPGAGTAPARAPPPGTRTVPEVTRSEPEVTRVPEAARGVMAEAAERPPEETLSRWAREQARLRARVLLADTEAWQRAPGFPGLRRVGGVDVSFAGDGGQRACACLVVLSFPELEIRLLRAPGDCFPLSGASGTVLGMALRTHARSTKPLYVSVGHRISLEAAVRLTLSCCRFKNPEPVRQEPAGAAATVLCPGRRGGAWGVRAAAQQPATPLPCCRNTASLLAPWLGSCVPAAPTAACPHPALGRAAPPRPGQALARPH
ncbi:endonuclease V isoform X3 [Sorex araneus]|uniref:endonuclease V isoform X3 n=1 Tax=Sorex araneus TaxID=42254 RepID=UPI0024336F1F|nr:endonuclease V isoform X3 [Sorex araneus]